MTQEEIEIRYSKIPQEIKNLKRWICYRIENKDGKDTKVPCNAINNSYARSNDPTTWTTFRVALMGCVKYGFAGLGFMLGEDALTHTNYFGIDLDNHADLDGVKPMTSDEFNDLISEFVNNLNSYSEYSHSGEGVHIICKGTLPVGARRKANCSVEMYEKGRFFTMTGNVINNVPIADRTNEIVPLWEKYLNTEKPIIVKDGINFGENVRTQVIDITPSLISDDELLDKIRLSRFGAEFNALYNGDMSMYGNDHSAADLALCKTLAFWTGCDKNQMDRIFRKSALMRPKWDELRGQDTYGNMTLNKAISGQTESYTPSKEKMVITIAPNVSNNTEIDTASDVFELDEKGDPIVSIKPIFKNYTLSDTGNAERFYDYFGDRFKYNKDNNYYMYWNGKTWTVDTKDYVRKYANKLLDVLLDEVNNTGKLYKEALARGEDGAEDAKYYKDLGKAQVDNWKKVSNKGGKDAMISELESLHDIPAKNSEFDLYESYLNTDSGVVDLYTGEIKPFDKKYMLSKNTNCKVSFEEPKVWLKFLADIFERKNPEETQEIIDTVQMALGESLTGRQNKEHLYILYGNGSNGKSTFIRVVNDVFGDYGTTMNSDMLIQNPNSSSQSREFSLAQLLGKRIVTTSETAEDKKLDEVTIKQMLSGEMINAQFKYGQPFSFAPSFSPWMSTNNKPIIHATDFGTWRRIVLIPFLNKFTKEKKDVDMPKKLKEESAQILGWMIQGSVKLHQQYKDDLPKPKCLEEVLSDYKKESDVVIAFIDARCLTFPGLEIEASKLYQVYKDWSKNNGKDCMPETKFRLELPKKGFEVRKDLNRGWVYCGLKLSEDKKGIAFGD